ncbi:DUF4886 domain-containing protein [Shewanella sedimentimangrovi]|uniref:SGNH/GDSL hydrolase family protein n=1 Tax=Shewanella sedimentimangrovi TaxID=2814293 RepID=A0ABX7QWA1_9GAMM|nr:DUF4886 domain-containing protein [Shewanella sedimentimangrovi]QSX35776.1 hypothetical protein JYB85_10325 [Shewanella sedimentimangrovi]
MKLIITCLLIMSAVLGPVSRAAEPTGHKGSAEQELRVLFIGNSYTGANYLPYVLKALADANNKALEVDAVIQNGTSLNQHWQQKIAQQKITAERWDYVVLQDASASAEEHPEETLHYGKLFSDLATQHLARTLLFNTWAYNGVPDWVLGIKDEQQRQQLSAFVPVMYERTNALYQQLAQKSKAELVPVGQIWQALKQQAPGMPLYGKDKSHPSVLGTYLTATVFYQALFGELPAKWPLSVNSVRNQTKMNEQILISVSKTQAQAMCSAISTVLGRNESCRI